MNTPVTDPELIAYLNAQEAQSPEPQGAPVTDPELIAYLNSQADRDSGERTWGEAFNQEVLGPANRGIAAGLGFPADLVTMAAQGLLNSPLGTSGNLPEDVVDPRRPKKRTDLPDWMGGSENIRKGMNAMGVDTPAPTTIFGRGVEGAASALTGYGLLAPLMGVGSQVNPVLHGVTEVARRHPLMTPLMEGSSGLGSGLAGGTMSQLTDDPTAQLMAEIVGGISHPLAMASTISQRGPKAAKEAIGIARSHLSETGAQTRAAERLREGILESGVNPIALGKGIDVKGTRTPAQQTEDPFLMNLEASLLGSTPKTRRDYEGYLKGQRQETEAGIRDLAKGNPEDTVRYLQGRRAEMDKKIDRRVGEAEARAQARLAELSPERSREVDNTVYREEMDKAFAASELEEDAAWNAADLTQMTDLTPLREDYNALVMSRKGAERELPEYVNRLLGNGEGAWGPVDTIDEVKSLRTRLMQDAKNLRKGETADRTLASKLDWLSGRALDTMSAPGGPALAEARAVSKKINETFREGTVGSLRRTYKGDTAGTPGEITLEASIGEKTGPRAVAPLNDLQAAVMTPESEAALQDFLKHRFIKKVAPGGSQPDPTKIQKFMEENADLLTRYPHFRQNMEDLANNQGDLKRVVEMAKTRASRTRDHRQSVATAYVGAPVGDRVKVALGSPDPNRAMQTLARQASRDSSGVATEGLQAQVVSELLEGTSRRSIGSGGEAAMSTERLLNRLERLWPAVDKVLTPEQKKGVETLAMRLAAAERQSRGGVEYGEVLDTAPSDFIDLASRVGGAQLGGASLLSQSTGSSLVMAQAGSKLARKFTERIPAKKMKDIYTEAIMNPALMKDLLTKHKGDTLKGVAKFDAALNRIHSYVFGLAPDDESAEASRM